MKLLLYCTKAKPYLIRFGNEYGYNQFDTSYCKEEHISPYEYGSEILNGKIVAECDFEVKDFKVLSKTIEGYKDFERKDVNYVLERSSLSYTELVDYLGEYNEGYAIHIKNLHIFDKPKELSEYCKYSYPNFNKDNVVEKAPQNMCRVLTKNGYSYILISIKPEWLCKILNGEKTIEIRKKVLKEML